MELPQELYCPRCRQKTLKLKRVRDILGEYHVYICEKCRFALAVEAVGTFTCIEPEDVKKLPDDLKTEIYDLLERGELRWTTKFDLATGQEKRCLDITRRGLEELARKVLIALERSRKQTA